MPLTVGMLGSYGGSNVGDEAILASSIAQLRAAVPDLEMVVFSRDAEHTRRHQDSDRAVNARETLSAQIRPEVERLDLLLLGGGGILYDVEAWWYLRVTALARQLGIPTFAFAVGIGPLDGRDDQVAVRDALNGMGGITVREVTAKRLCDDIGVTVSVEVTADPALLLEPLPYTDNMLAREAIPTGRRLIGFSIRERGGAAPTLEQSAYHELMADAADYCVQRYDAELVVVLMERADRNEMHHVIARMSNAERAHVLRNSYHPREVLGLVRRFDMVAGMRLHFLIFAALFGVPLLALPYATKVRDLVTSLGIEHQVSVESARVGTFLTEVEHLWGNRADQLQRVAERLPMVQQLARRTVPRALALVGCGPGPDTVHVPKGGEELASAPIVFWTRDGRPSAAAQPV